MELPKIVKNFRLYIGGNDTGVNVEEIQLPQINEKLESIQMGAIEVETSMGYEKMEAELTLLEHDYKIWMQYGTLNNTTGQLLTLRGYQDNNHGDVDEIMIMMRGRFSSLDLGTFKRADKNTYKMKISILSFTYQLNDVPYFVINPVTNTVIIGGVNMLEKQNKALGI